MATTKVTRLDHYPIEDPTGWAVGFTVTTDNGRSFYRDTVISFTDASNDNLAIDLAYGRLSSKLHMLTASYEKQGSRLGSEYVDRENPPVILITYTEEPIVEEDPVVEEGFANPNDPLNSGNSE